MDSSSSDPTHTQSESGFTLASRHLKSLACKEDHSNSPLFDVCRRNRSDTAERLLSSKQVHPQMLTPGGMSPLMLACLHGSIDVMRILIRHGADPNYAVHGHHPLPVASDSCRPEATNPVQELLDGGASLSTRKR